METKQRFFALDFLKFLLAILIVFCHFQQITGARFSVINFYGIKLNFGYAVECFFMISGFVTALSLERRTPNCFRCWISEKIIRIFPMSSLSVIITLIVFLLYKFIIGIFPNDSPIGLWQLLNSLTLTFVGSGVGDIALGINNPIWYLCILIICYIITYCIYWISKKIKVNQLYFYIFMITIGVGILTYEINLPFLNNKTGRGYSAFFLGMILKKVKDRVPLKSLIIIALSFLFMVFIAGVFQTGIDNQWGIFTFMIWPSVIILFLSIEKFFSYKIVNLLGCSSFEMYLWHVSIIRIYSLIKVMIGKTEYTFIEMLLLTFFIILFSIFIYKVAEIPLTNRLKSIYLEK